MKKVATFLLECLIRIVGLLPLSAIRAIGGTLGRITYHVNGRAVQVTRLNLKMCYPQLDESAREVLCKSSLIETGKTGTEICFIWTRPAQDIFDCIIEVEGKELMDDGLAKGRGVVILAPHLGNWEVLGHHLAKLAPTMNLYQPPKNAGVAPMMLKGRTATGAQLAPTNAKGVAALLKHLKNGGICGILPDQVPLDTSSGVFAPFFGHLASTITLPQKLIQKNNSAAFFAFAKRQNKGFKIIFRAVPNDIYNNDPFIAASALNKGVESLVNEAPEQYQWEYKRFRARPTKEAKDPYTG